MPTWCVNTTGQSPSFATDRSSKQKFHNIQHQSSCQHSHTKTLGGKKLLLNCTYQSARKIFSFGTQLSFRPCSLSVFGHIAFLPQIRERFFQEPRLKSEQKECERQSFNKLINTGQQLGNLRRSRTSVTGSAVTQPHRTSQSVSRFEMHRKVEFFSQDRHSGPSIVINKKVYKTFLNGTLPVLLNKISCTDTELHL